MLDNNKKESETIRQQRKAREDFLELKKMQSGESSAPPPPSAEAILPTTFNEKLKNFLFYNRFIVLGVAFLLIVFAILFNQCVSRIDYDICVTVYTSSPVGENDLQRMAEYFEKICDDINGDGEVHVQIIDCSFSKNSNRQLSIAANQKLQSVLVAEYKAMLFITDDYTLDYMQSISSEESFFEDTVMLDKSFYDFCETEDLFKLPSDIKLSRRKINKTTMKDNKTAILCYETAGKMIDSIRDK